MTDHRQPIAITGHEPDKARHGVTRLDDAWDVIVVGGGPAGLMAAIAAREGGARTLLVDKGDRLGRKLGISGGGRCNVTNNKETAELIRYFSGNGKFLHSALSRFGSREIIAFFEGLGIRLKEEDDGRMFPATDKASTVVAALVGRVRELGVEVRVNEPVERVLYDGGRAAGVRLRSGERLRARCVIVATGGMSVPRTGSPVYTQVQIKTVSFIARGFSFPLYVPASPKATHIPEHTVRNAYTRTHAGRCSPTWGACWFCTRRLVCRRSGAYSPPCTNVCSCIIRRGGKVVQSK